jgi:tetratricopeptide (TPR) repeat protein
MEMMMRIKNSKLCFNTVCKAIVQQNVRRYFNVFSLGLMTLFLVELATNVVSAVAAVEDDLNLPQIAQTDPNVLEQLELFGTQLSSSESRKEQESRNRLRRIIEQVRSVKFDSEIKISNVSVEPNEAPVQEPNETVPEVILQKKEETKKTIIEPPKKQVSDMTLSMLKDIKKNPDQLDDPFEMGELLFAGGNTKDAVIFYREALKRTDPNDVRLSQERAWILFQIGNCLRYHEPVAATETYRKLLVEYPNSLWTDLAKAQKEFIDWSLIEKPRELIAESGTAIGRSNEN